MSKKRLQLRATIARQSKLEVDKTGSGVIKGVSVITIGEAMGHGFNIDATTLAQVAAAINSADVPVKSRITHPEGESITLLAGRWKNGRVDGDCTRADFHFGSYAEHSPAGNLRAYLLGLAEDAPEDCGVSIVADDIEFARVGETDALRLLGPLTAIDWVGTPAANPVGMLSAPIEPQANSSGGASPSATSAPVMKGITMNPKQIAFLQSIGLAAGANDQQVADFVAALDNDKKAALEAAAVETPAPAPAAVAAAAKPSAAVALAAPRTVNHAELSELNDLATLSDLGGEWAMKMALDGVSLAEARKLALAEKAKARKPIALAGSGVVTGGEDLNLSTLDQAVSDALCLKLKISPNAIPDLDSNKRPIMLSTDDGKRTMQRRKAHERSGQFRNLPLLEMARHHLMALGLKHSDAIQLDRGSLASACLVPSAFRGILSKHGVALAQSTTDFANLLADSMNKTLRNAYAVAQPTWPMWAQRKTAPDFKTIRSVQLSEAPTLVAMPEGDEVEYGYLQDSGETAALGTYAKGLKFTRQAAINDDLDALSRVLMLMGRAAQRLEETTAYGVLTGNAAMADTVAIFATAHANLVTGVLTVDNIGAAVAKMLIQTPLGGASAGPIASPSSFTLVVPTSKWVLASKIINSPVDPALNNNTPNVLGAYPINVVHSPILEASSAIIWYLIANYNDIEGVNVYFLEGQEGPRFGEEIEFDTDALKMKVGHDIVAKAVEYRGMIRSSGA